MNYVVIKDHKTIVFSGTQKECKKFLSENWTKENPELYITQVK